MACGDVFRSLDLNSEIGTIFMEYSSRGELVPDEVTVQFWKNAIEAMITLGRFKPGIDHLLLDGIPRNLEQAKILEDHLDVRKVFYLKGPDEEELINRMRKRALKENRFDDANDEVIRKRLETYHEETAPLLEFYGGDKVVEIDSTLYPYEVLREVVQHIDTRS